MTVTYDSELITKLWEVFPDAFSTSKVSPVTESYNGRFGPEETIVGEETIILAECIAATAKAISRCGTNMDGALKYIESYKPAWIQNREIRNFLR